MADYNVKKVIRVLSKRKGISIAQNSKVIELFDYVGIDSWGKIDFLKRKGFRVKKDKRIYSH